MRLRCGSRLLGRIALGQAPGKNSSRFNRLSWRRALWRTHNLDDRDSSFFGATNHVSCSSSTGKSHHQIRVFGRALPFFGKRRKSTSHFWCGVLPRPNIPTVSPFDRQPFGSSRFRVENARNIDVSGQSIKDLKYRPSVGK